MARSKEAFPEWFAEALILARTKGFAIAEFETESECTRERLKFYRFLREARAEGIDGADRCVVQWLIAPNSQSRKVLRFEISQSTVNPLHRADENAETINDRLEIERMLAEMRKDIGKT